MAEFLPTQGQPQAQQPEMIPTPQQGQPQGLPAGTGLAQIEPDPRNTPDEAVGEDEQKEYDDLFIRVMAAVHDIRVPPNAQKSLADQTIQLLSNKDKEPHESIGQTAGLIMTQMIGMAKSQKKEYQPDIIREVGMDLIHELYMIASESGAIENLPEDDSKGYQAIIEQAALEAVKLYGENLLQTGGVNVEFHKKELQHQMQREADSGELDNRGMEEFDEEARFSMAQRIKGGGNGQS